PASDGTRAPGLVGGRLGRGGTRRPGRRSPQSLRTQADREDRRRGCGVRDLPCRRIGLGSRRRALRRDSRLRAVYGRRPARGAPAIRTRPGREQGSRSATHAHRHRSPMSGRADYLVFGSPDLRESEIDEVLLTLRSAWIGTGPRVERFEEAFREYVDAPNAIAVHSCTAALHLAMVALDLRAEDEVIVPAMTFASTANAVIHAGGHPVLADVDRETMCLTPDEIARRHGGRTRAVIPVHFAGRPCAIEEIVELSGSLDLAVIEDCAHAIETLVGRRHAGTFGDFGAFSFYVTKNVVTGEGGM